MQDFKIKSAKSYNYFNTEKTEITDPFLCETQQHDPV